MRYILSLLLLSFGVLFAGCFGDSDVPTEEPIGVQDFTNGWYDLESNQVDEWRWSSGHASIVLENNTTQSERVVVRYQVMSLVERSLQLALGGAEIASDSVPADEWLPREIALNLPVGISVLTFDTEEPGVMHPGDTRDLHFCIRNFELIVPSEGSDPSVLDPDYSQIPQIFENGWYDLETSEKEQWRWAMATASVALNNKMPQSQEVEISYDVRSLVPRSVRLSLNGNELSSVAVEVGDWAPHRVTVNLTSGSSILTFNTAEKGVMLSGDTRDLHFSIRNFQLRIPFEETNTN